MTTKHYNTKESWETYPHEEPEKYVDPDRKHPKFYIVWRDKIGYRCAEVTDTQHQAFWRLTKILGHDHMMNVGMNLVNVIQLFGKSTIRSMINKGIFKIQAGRLWLTSHRVPYDDQFIENGLREGGKAMRASYCEKQLFIHTACQQ